MNRLLAFLSPPVDTHTPFRDQFDDAVKEREAREAKKKAAKIAHERFVNSSQQTPQIERKELLKDIKPREPRIPFSLPVPADWLLTGDNPPGAPRRPSVRQTRDN